MGIKTGMDNFAANVAASRVGAFMKQAEAALDDLPPELTVGEGLQLLPELAPKALEFGLSYLEKLTSKIPPKLLAVSVQDLRTRMACAPSGMQWLQLSLELGAGKRLAAKVGIDYGKVLAAVAALNGEGAHEVRADVDPLVLVLDKLFREANAEPGHEVGADIGDTLAALKDPSGGDVGTTSADAEHERYLPRAFSSGSAAQRRHRALARKH